MMKEPEARATYAELLVSWPHSYCLFDLIVIQEHAFLVEDHTRTVDMSGWVARALEHRDQLQASTSETNL